MDGLTKTYTGISSHKAAAQPTREHYYKILQIQQRQGSVEPVHKSIALIKPTLQHTIGPAIL